MWEKHLMCDRTIFPTEGKTKARFSTLCCLKEKSKTLDNDLACFILLLLLFILYFFIE